MKSRIGIMFMVVAAIVAGGSADALSVTYTQIIDLGTPEGAVTSQARALNDGRQVVGYAYNGSNYEAFLWDNGVMTNLGTLGGNYSYAYDINNASQVVGLSHTGSAMHAFVWDAGTGMASLGSIVGNYSQAYGINESGQVAGTGSSMATGAYVWDPSTGAIALDASGPDDGTSYAFGINDVGQVTGALSDGGPAAGVAFMWDPFAGMTILFSTDAENGVVPWAINNSSQVAGYIQESSHGEAFIWDPVTGLTWLGSLGGGSAYAQGINDSGLVVGMSDGEVPVEAFVWEEGSGMVSLNSLTGVAGMENWRRLEIAYDVNNSGDIVGRGLTADFQTHAFLLLAERVVPEPASVTLLGIGLAGLVCRGMRKKRERA